MAAPNDDPLKQLLELFVYAPTGILLEAKRLYPSIVESGRQHFDNQVKLARFVGEFAVRQGRKVAEQRVDAFLRPQPSVVATLPASTLPTLPVATLPAATLPAAETTAVTTAGAGVTGSDAADEIAVESLAIDGYDALAASQIVGRLAALSSDELDLVGRYEASHRARRTILGQVVRLRPDAS